MSDVQALLALALSGERSAAERLRSLQELEPFLQDEPVVLALGSAAGVEPHPEVRRALLAALVRVDVTRLRDRAAHLGHLVFLAAVEPERASRRLAVARLASLVAMDEGVELLLAELLSHDLDDGVQEACLEGLARCPRKRPGTVAALLGFARVAPRPLRGKLRGLYAQLDRPDCEAGLLSLLCPLEAEADRSRVLDLLARLPSLSAGTGLRLLEVLEQEPSAALQDRIVELLSSAVQPSPELLERILARLRRTPGQTRLLAAFGDRLVSLPAVLPALAELFQASSSTRLKCELLRLVEGAGPVPLLLLALDDASPWVRALAIEHCRPHVQARAEALVPALVHRLAREPLTALRRSLAALLVEVRTLGAEAERGLARWFARETDPEAQELLATALLRVPLDRENQGELLAAFTRIARAPFFGPATRAAILARLRSFAYTDAPGLADCLAALLLRARTVEEAEELHGQLARLEADPRARLPLLQLVFHRFIGDYPQAPLDRLLRTFHDLAPGDPELRRQLPWLAQLTGEGWILSAADAADQKANLLPGIVEALARGRSTEARQLLTEAYENRAMRRSDLVRLFERLLHHHDRYELLEDVLRLMAEAHVTSSAIIDRCLDFLSRFPQASVVHALRGYLQQTAALDPTYAERLQHAFSPASYSEYCLRHLGPRDAAAPQPRWTSGQWRLLHPGWPVGELFLETKPRACLARAVAEPPAPAVPALRSLQYLALHALWGLAPLTASEVAAVDACRRQTRGVPGQSPLHDRALFVLSTGWPGWLRAWEKDGAPVPAELARAAAEAFLEQCERRIAYLGKAWAPPVVPLAGLDLLWLEARWSAGAEAWEELWSAYQARLSPEDPVHQRTPRPTDPPLDFAPLERDETPVLEFLLKTPVPPQGPWPARWRRLLSLAKVHRFGLLNGAASRLTDAERAAVLPLLS